MRQDGSIVGYNEVSNLAGLHRPPIQLRTGCFCNPGACQSALNLSDKEVMENYLTSGHICGDRKDIINNKPTGAIRTSFGKDSIWEDVDSMVLFLQNKFVSEVTLPSEGSVANDEGYPYRRGDLWPHSGILLTCLGAACFQNMLTAVHDYLGGISAGMRRPAGVKELPR